MRAAMEESKRKRRRSFTRTKTAEKVADILEDTYDIVHQFELKYAREISDIVAKSFTDYSVNVLAGGADELEEGFASRRHKIVSERMVKFMKPSSAEIEKLFRKFLDREEIVAPGVPTLAALYGVRRGRKTGKRRPSFIDTGIYRASFRAWADIK
jgi:cobalamin-dependent methionine synthase I